MPPGWTRAKRYAAEKNDSWMVDDVNPLGDLAEQW